MSSPGAVPRWLERLTVVAAVLTVPAVVLDEAVTQGVWDVVGHVLNWLVWGVFALHLAVLLARAADRRAAVRSNVLLVAIVTLTWPYLPAGLQAVRVLGLLRLVTVAGHARRMFSLQGVHYAALVLLITVLAGGAAFAGVEHAQHLSVREGVWWAIVTVTTVGYGDIVPHTEAGRALAVVVMAVGIGTATLLIGAAAQRFVETGDDTEGPNLEDLQRDLRALRAEVRALSDRLLE